MSTTTTNLGLTKPEGTEYADVDVLNDNADIIDSAVGELQHIVLRGDIKDFLIALWQSSDSLQLDLYDANGDGLIVIFDSTRISLLKHTSSGNTTLKTWS